MTLSTGVFSFMSAGLSVGDRVAPISLPQHADLPFLVYRVISVQVVITHQSAQDHPLFDGIRYCVARIQFDCYGGTHEEAEALADELLDYAAGFKGLWGELRVDRVDPAVRVADWDSDPGLHRVMQDLFVGYQQGPGS